MLKVVCEKYLAFVNGWVDALLVIEVRRVADRRKNDILMDDWRYFYELSFCLVDVGSVFNYYLLSFTSAQLLIVKS
jgi:hypothetical protein